MTDEPIARPLSTDPRWQPLSAVDRRVAGVLVEKAKTTPDVYPMSLNAICTASNQKSNRHPIMQLETDDVEASLERLRDLGAVAIVQGYGRVYKYRHYLYEWLGVDKVELAVMAELLLRGAQTEGELRGRAARMEPIADLGALRPVLASLKSKGLVVSLTPEGRGHVVAHALYSPGEMEKLKAQYTGGYAAPALAADFDSPPVESASSVPAITSRSVGAAPPSVLGPEAVGQAVRSELDVLRAQLAELRSDLNHLAEAFRQTQEELQRLRSELGA